EIKSTDGADTTFGYAKRSLARGSLVAIRRSRSPIPLRIIARRLRKATDAAIQDRHAHSSLAMTVYSTQIPNRSVRNLGERSPAAGIPTTGERVLPGRGVQCAGAAWADWPDVDAPGRCALASRPLSGQFRRARQ